MTSIEIRFRPSLQSLAAAIGHEEKGTVPNQVQRPFNGLGQLIAEYQAHSGAVKDRFQYGYDRDGNRTYRLNALTHNNPQVPQGFDELYHNGAAAIDTYDPMTGNLTTAGYDRLNQLTAFRRGTLNLANTDLTTGSQTHSQDWSLDVMGNWSSVLTDGTPQNRSHNQLNEVTAVGSATPRFDGNGNTTRDETGRGLVYDAWDELVSVGGGTPTSYFYDALGRRIQELSNGINKDLYFSDQSQVLEEREGSLVRIQDVWSSAYVDALVLRDRDPNSSGSLTERLYVQQDANYNVTALVATSGAVAERYVYDSYGKPSILNPITWQPTDPRMFAMAYLHQGGRFDGNTGLYSFRDRDYSPALGRWLQIDPLGYVGGGADLYRYVANNPINLKDPSGDEAEAACDNICKITKITLVAKKKDIPKSAPTGLKFPRALGEAQRDMVGPYNDPNGNGNLKNVNWVVWEGKNLGDCEFKRYISSTVSFEGGKVIQTVPDKSKGFLGKGKKKSDQGSRPDGPNPSGVRPENPSDSVVVADPPGFRGLNPKAYPVSFETNFYVRAVSKKDKSIKGEIWYDVIIKATGPGPNGVTQNEATLTEANIPK